MGETGSAGAPLTSANWSRRLPQTLVIPSVMTLRTLDDVRAFMRYLPEDRRARHTWRGVKQQLEQAAGGGDLVDVDVALRLALSTDGVECRPN